jgi:glycerate-2-kinase
VEDNAGAIVTPDTLARCAQRGIKPADHADRKNLAPVARAPCTHTWVLVE